MNLFEIQGLCRNEIRAGKYSVSIHQRFIIGMYQIYQGMEWKGTDSSGESFMSAIFHWLVVCEEAKLEIENYISKDISKWGEGYVSDIEFILAQSKVAQMLNYYSGGTGRASRRYKKDVFEENIATCIEYCAFKTHGNKESHMKLALNIALGVL